MSEEMRERDGVKVDVSVIIVNWNTRDLLAQCLKSVFDTAGDLALELFVVDNASSDGSADMVRERFPQVRLIENSENVGFAKANNQAIRQSRGRYVLLLNPDTEVKPLALEMLVRFMDETPLAGAVGGTLVSPDGSMQPSSGPAPTLMRELWRLFHMDRLNAQGCHDLCQDVLKIPQEVEVVKGACMLLRREALDQVGLLDEDYFIYTEEVDLCHRLRASGWKVYCVPRAMVVHYGGQSTSQVQRTMFLHLYRSKILFFRKHHGRLSAQLYKLILLCAALARLTISPLAWLERSPQRERHRSLASCYLQLVKILPRL